MIGSAAPASSSGSCRAATFDAVYATGPDVVLAGAFNPTGVATPIDGGYRATGRWSFASGCQHADWFVGPLLRRRRPDAADPHDGGARRRRRHRRHLVGVRTVRHRQPRLHARRRVRAGATARSASSRRAGCDGPLGRIPELSFSSLGFANVALGIAEGALAEITTLATAKVPMFATTTLAANPLFRNQLGEADAHLRAARPCSTPTSPTTWAAGR